MVLMFKLKVRNKVMPNEKDKISEIHEYGIHLVNKRHYIIYQLISNELIFFNSLMLTFNKIVRKDLFTYQLSFAIRNLLTQISIIKLLTKKKKTKKKKSYQS